MGSVVRTLLSLNTCVKHTDMAYDNTARSFTSTLAKANSPLSSCILQEVTAGNITVS